MIVYKAKLNGIRVVYVNPGDTSNTCHRCERVTSVEGREFRCAKRGSVYNRDLNASINIARALMRGTGQGYVNTLDGDEGEP